MNTTLNKIKAFKPCEDGWKKLLTYLNKTEADDEELSLLTILESNGLNHALWALRTVEGYELEKRLIALDFSESRNYRAVAGANWYADDDAETERKIAIFKKHVNK